MRFNIDSSLSIVLKKRVRGDVLLVGQEYDVEWSAKEQYSAVLLAIGEFLYLLATLYLISTKSLGEKHKMEKK